MSEQLDPLKFFNLCRWLDRRPLLTVMEPYRQTILHDALYAFREDGAPQYKRVLTGRAKKNSKTSDAVWAALYKLLAWKAAGQKGNQIYFVASDLGQANDALDLCKKLIAVTPILAHEVDVYRNVVHRKDGQGFIEILPSGDALGLHGKTYLFLVVSELHTQKDYRVLEALELDRTRPDAVQWFESYAPVSPTPGLPVNDLLKQHAAQSDPRLYVSWYSGTIEEANPSLNGPLGPTLEDVLDAQRALPSWIFRRLYLNLPGQPDSAAFDAGQVEAAIVRGRTVLRPQADIHYVPFTDLSGGGADDATLGIAHARDGRAILDCLIDQGPRTKGLFSPEQAVATFAAVLQTYGCATVTGDRYAGEWPRQAFLKHGITYRPAELTRTQIYTAFEPLLNSGQVALLDQPTVLAQLIGLVRKGEKIDHPSTEHDDHANAAAGALVLASKAATTARWAFSSGGRTISMTDQVMEQTAAAAMTLVDSVRSVGQTIRSAFSRSVQQVETTIESASKEPQTIPTPDGHTRTVQEIAAMRNSWRSPAEQQRLDAFCRSQEPTSEIEAAVMQDGCYWPSELPANRITVGTDGWQAEVRKKFQRWR